MNVTDSKLKQLQEEIERLRNENALLLHEQSLTEERNNRNRYLLKYLSDYIYTVKIYDGNVIETNHGSGCFAVTGYDSQDYLNDPELWYNMVHPDDRDAVTEQSQKARSGENVPELQHRIIHRDGTVKWVRNTIVIVRNSEGHVTHYYGLINDITDLKKAEQLTDIKNEQLIQADKMASIGILASGIAHEINNPNNFVLLNTELFKKFWDDTKPILQEYFQNNGDFVLGGIPYQKAREKVDQLLSGLEKGAKRIQLIVNRLKEFTGAEPKESARMTDINLVVKNAILITGSMINKSTKDFKAVLADQLPQLYGIPHQLEQVVINLINNACQSLTDKNKRISVSTLYDPENKNIKIMVTDEGHGIDEQDLKNIFNPFFTTKRNYGGTGLGLSISYNIVKSHNGELLYNSIPGEGTTATVILPIYEH